jgi:DNA polymerase-1
VDGIGAKTALSLIQKFGSVETLFEDIALVEEKVAKKIRGQKDAALFSKKLATINRAAPLYFDSLEDLRVGALDFDELKKYFSELGFESLVGRMG